MWNWEKVRSRLNHKAILPGIRWWEDAKQSSRFPIRERKVKRGRKGDRVKNRDYRKSKARGGESNN